MTATLFSDHDFADLFGAQAGAVRAAAGVEIDRLRPGYAPIVGPERDRLIAGILERIDDATLKASGAHRQTEWEGGWQENYDEFVASDGDLRALVPKYFRPGAPFRFRRAYVRAEDPDAIYKITCAFRAWLFRTWVGDQRALYEFGCGTAHHLAHAAQLFPGMELHGYDWAPVSQKIVEALARRFGWPIAGGRFDFFAPDRAIRFPPGSVAFTFGALEQVGERFHPYLDFLLERRPSLCIDVAGLYELYDTENLADSLAARYHLRRNYLRGYLPRLCALEQEGAITILKVHRQEFGNLYDDPHSYVIWKPGKD